MATTLSTFSLTNRAAQVVTTAGGHGDDVVAGGRGPGAATLTETAVAGWTLTGAVCARNGVVYPSTPTTGGLSLTINPGSDITCTFTNSAPQTSLSLSSSKNPSALGESVTFTASVSSTFGSPSGFVDFHDGAVLLGSSLLEDGVASMSTSSLTLGSHTVTVKNYSGQSPFASSSGTLVQVVRLIDSDLVLTKEGPPTANVGEELTFTIKVKNNGPDVATNVMVNDTLPSGLEWVSVQSGCTGLRRECHDRVQLGHARGR